MHLLAGVVVCAGEEEPGLGEEECVGREEECG